METHVSLRQLREQHKLTQAQLAKMLGVRRATISRWEAMGDKHFPHESHVSPQLMSLAIRELKRRLDAQARARARAQAQLAMSDSPDREVVAV